MIQIESGVPIPSQRPNSKYPFKDLDVGQSFFAPGANPNPIRVLASRLGRDWGRKFKTMKVSGGMRVWRVA